MTDGRYVTSIRIKDDAEPFLMKNKLGATRTMRKSKCGKSIPMLNSSR